MDCSPPGSSVPGILQARILEWVVISFSRRSSRPRDRTQDSFTAGRFFSQLSRLLRTWTCSLSATPVVSVQLLQCRKEPCSGGVLTSSPWWVECAHVLPGSKSVSRFVQERHSLQARLPKISSVGLEAG